MSLERRRLMSAYVAEVVLTPREKGMKGAIERAREEGILVGISSGGSLAAINQKINDFSDGARILTFCYDTGERYLSTEGLF